MKPLRILEVYLILGIHLYGCSESPPALDDSSIESSVQLGLVLSRIDSIGIELGDSNYVFGNVLDADFMPDGRIVLLDVRKDRVSVFTPDGEFISSFGREGSGPGEFSEPASIAVLSNGEICVTDFIRKKLIFFDREFDYLREVSGFVMQAPASIEDGSNGSVIGFQTDYCTQEDEFLVGSRLACWTDSCTPDFVYASRYNPFNGDGPVTIPQFAYATGSDGCLYYAEISREQYRILKLSSEGDTLFTIQEPYTPMNLTEEEQAGAHFGYVLDTPGFDSNDRRRISNSRRMDPVRYAISSVHVDGNDRLWVATGRGEQSAPQFEIYDSSGNHLSTYITELPAEMRNGSWKFVFGSDRVLVFDTNPEDYSRVLIYEIDEQ